MENSVLGAATSRSMHSDPHTCFLLLHSETRDRFVPFETCRSESAFLTVESD